MGGGLSPLLISSTYFAETFSGLITVSRIAFTPRTTSAYLRLQSACGRLDLRGLFSRKFSGGMQIFQARPGGGLGVIERAVAVLGEGFHLIPGLLHQAQNLPH